MAGCFKYKCFLCRFPVKFCFFGLSFSDVLAAADSWLKLLRTLHKKKKEKRDLGEIGAPKKKKAWSAARTFGDFLQHALTRGRYKYPYKYILLWIISGFFALFELPRVRAEQGRAGAVPTRKQSHPLPPPCDQLALECFVIKTLWTSFCIQFLIPAGRICGFSVDFPWIFLWNWRIGTKDTAACAWLTGQAALEVFSCWGFYDLHREMGVGRGFNFFFFFFFPKVFRAIKWNFPSDLKKEIN